MAVAVEFSTIPEMFRNVTGKFAAATRPALMYKAGGKYEGIGYTDLRTRVERFAFGLASLGVGRGDRIAIISENRPEWVISDQAIVALGAIDVPVYPTMSAKQNEYIFNDAGVRIAIVSNQFQLNKVMRVWDNVPSLERIILMNEKANIVEPATINFSEVMRFGDAYRVAHPDLLDNAMLAENPEDLLTLIYTSGTTGNPKGVMLTHRNLVSNIISSAEVIDFGPEDLLLSFLPLSHTFERMAGYYTAFSCGATIAYAESVETVAANMTEVRPTIVTTVPRLFERIHSRVIKQVDAGPAIKEKIFRWAVTVGKEHAAAARQGRVSLLLRAQRALADRLVFCKLREKTGGRMRFFVSGGAALARELGEFFEAVGLTVIEGYGLTESSPVIAANRLHNYRFGSVGQVIPGVEVRIEEDGEILARGPNIMKGYWGQPDATAQAIDGDGWLHTGDVGMVDAGGFLHITDRKKHLFVSSGGKNIAPQPIENLFLSSKYIEQLMLIGDHRMYLTALIVPDFEALKEYAEGRNLSYANDSDLARHAEIYQLIERDINEIQKDLANYERVRRFTLLDRLFTVEEGELTPTQKIRRNVVEQRYASLIENMYEGVV
jgi:long-chain acyl-CoA synthetase